MRREERRRGRQTVFEKLIELCIFLVLVFLQYLQPPAREKWKHKQRHTHRPTSFSTLRASSGVLRSSRTQGLDAWNCNLKKNLEPSSSEFHKHCQERNNKKKIYKPRTKVYPETIANHPVVPHLSLCPPPTAQTKRSHSNTPSPHVTLLPVFSLAFILCFFIPIVFLSSSLPPSLLQDEEGFDQQSYLVLRHEIEKAHRRISHLQNTPPDRAEPAFLLVPVRWLLVACLLLAELPLQALSVCVAILALYFHLQSPDRLHTNNSTRAHRQSHNTSK